MKLNKFRIEACLSSQTQAGQVKVKVRCKTNSPISVLYRSLTLYTNKYICISIYPFYIHIFYMPLRTATDSFSVCVNLGRDLKAYM